MNIKIKDTITLSDNNEYVVVSRIDYQGAVFYYLVDINNLKNIKFCRGEDNIIEELDDKELIKTLLPMFFDETNKVLDSEV